MNCVSDYKRLKHCVIKDADEDNAHNNPDEEVACIHKGQDRVDVFDDDGIEKTHHKGKCRPEKRDGVCNACDDSYEKRPLEFKSDNGEKGDKRDTYKGAFECCPAQIIAYSPVDVVEDREGYLKIPVRDHTDEVSLNLSVIYKEE